MARKALMGRTNGLLGCWAAAAAGGGRSARPYLKAVKKNIDMILLL
jgi:hypothetical protein